ncbi:MAG: YraN family protein [Nocardioidaceae bacterium]|nr:YraN family protein [Nocardioidaceae bacterium]
MPQTSIGAHNQAVGRYGERVAARHLSRLGLHLLDRNWRCDAGEIDLVLRDGATLVVCEVKTRVGSRAGAPHEAVTDTKLERLRLLGERWQEARGVRARDVRIDLVAVILGGRGAPQVDHVRGIG